jgi:hypothetical protein
MTNRPLSGKDKVAKSGAASAHVRLYVEVFRVICIRAHICKRCLVQRSKAASALNISIAVEGSGAAKWQVEAPAEAATCNIPFKHTREKESHDVCDTRGKKLSAQHTSHTHTSHAISSRVTLRHVHGTMHEQTRPARAP